MERLTLARPPLPALPLTGGCHCGAVRYRVDVHPRAVNACHCRDCKRLAGAAFGMYLHVPRHAFHAEGALDVFARTGGSGNRIAVERCRGCGARMWHLPEVAPELVLLCAGTLDDSRWAVPSSHIFVEEAAHDAVAAHDALVLVGPPASRALLWERFSELYPDALR